MDFMNKMGGLGQYTEYAKYVEGLDFPADKQEIIEHLHDKNAPDNVISVAEKIPDKVYSSLDEVIDQVKQHV